MKPEINKRIISRIVDHVRNMIGYCDGIAYEQFVHDRMLQEACVFNVLQVGELAARAIENGMDAAYPQIAWKPMRGMRNRIVHDYAGIKLDTVWDTIQNDFPDLLAKLKELL